MIREQINVSPDGLRYLAMPRRRMPRPFHLRWLVPQICRGQHHRYLIVTSLSLVLMPFAEWWFTGRWQTGLAVFGLSGVWQFNRKFPVLVDAPAMTLTILSAASWVHGLWPLALVLSTLAGATKETAPLFVALFAWHPLLLVGLVAPLVRLVWRSGPDVLPSNSLAHLALVHPLQAARARPQLSDPRRWLTPWGVLLVGFYDPSTQLLVVLAAAYAQCVVATDDARLYQWAWPVLALAALDNIPPAWLLLALAVHLCNPWKGQGA